MSLSVNSLLPKFSRQKLVLTRQKDSLSDYVDMVDLSSYGNCTAIYNEKMRKSMLHKSFCLYLTICLYKEFAAQRSVKTVLDNVVLYM